MLRCDVVISKNITNIVKTKWVYLQVMRMDDDLKDLFLVNKYYESS